MPDPYAFPRAGVPHHPDQPPKPVRRSGAFSCRDLCHLSESLTLQDSALAEHLLDRSAT